MVIRVDMESGNIIDVRESEAHNEEGLYSFFVQSTIDVWNGLYKNAKKSNDCGAINGQS